MRLIKISPKFQITIPKTLRHICNTGWLSINIENEVITLRSINVQESKTEQEFLEELINQTSNIKL